MVADPMSDRGAGPTDRAMGLLAKLSGEFASVSKANRQLVEHLVVGEIERVALRLGFARTDDVAAVRRQLDLLTDEVAGLHAEIDDLRSRQAEVEDAAARSARSPRKSAAGRTRAATTSAAATPVPSPAPTATKPAARRRAATKAARKTAAAPMEPAADDV